VHKVALPAGPDPVLVHLLPEVVEAVAAAVPLGPVLLCSCGLPHPRLATPARPLLTLGRVLRRVLGQCRAAVAAAAYLMRAHGTDADLALAHVAMHHPAALCVSRPACVGPTHRLSPQTGARVPASVHAQLALYGAMGGKLDMNDAAYRRLRMPVLQAARQGLPCTVRPPRYSAD
jgi:hypothetical protein